MRDGAYIWRARGEKHLSRKDFIVLHLVVQECHPVTSEFIYVQTLLQNSVSLN